MQYGHPSKHKNEEARSRFITMASTFFYLYIILFYFILFWQLFNQTATLFQHSVTNTPESIMPGGITTKGRIEHQLKVFGELTTMAYVEVLSSRLERQLSI